MSKTLKGKLLLGTIISVISINIIFTIFISIYLNNSFKDDVIEEMNKIKITALNIVNQNEIMEEPIWKSLSPINEILQGYVSISNINGEVNQSVGNIISKEDVDNIIIESNNTSSLIKFKLSDGDCFITYNYPIYNNDNFIGNLIMQKEYIYKYNKMIQTIMIILLGQVLVVTVVIISISLIINKAVKPLNTLKDSMENFQLGNNIKDIEIDTKDEISDLATTYNLMKNQLIIQDKAMREFFNNATHELKTPVTSISLYSQILRDKDIEEIDQEFLKRASTRIALECDKMKKLVENILESSKGRINKNKNKTEFSLTKTIKEIIEDLELRLKDKDLYIIDKLEEVKVFGILEDFKQIVLNLLDNSIKYSSSKKISLMLYKENEKIILKIKNQCLEIHVDIRDRLLEPFIKFNYHKDISKEVSSSGLGLYLCNELAKENNWILNYEIRDRDIIFFLIINI